MAECGFGAPTSFAGVGSRTYFYNPDASLAGIAATLPTNRKASPDAIERWCKPGRYEASWAGQWLLPGSFPLSHLECIGRRMADSASDANGKNASRIATWP